MTQISRADFDDFNNRFTAAFNRDDLDGVMEFFAEDALYAELNGTENRGKKAIREAFEPQFKGDFGQVRFHGEDSFVDEETGKALSRWRCTVEIDGQKQEFRGLDIYRLENGLVKEKLTYAQTSMPLLKAI
jgi:ketosteroid isomerase-like protein